MISFKKIFSILFFALIAACSSNNPALILSYDPSEATVTIDGHEAQEYSSPHTYNFHKPGKYALKVEAPGYIPVQMHVELKKGQKLELPISLVPYKTSGSQTAQDLSSVEIAQQTEVDLQDMENDEHKSSIFSVQVSTNPKGALVFTKKRGDSEEQRHGPTPVSIELTDQGPYELSIKMSGYETLIKTIIPPRNNTPVIVNASLKRSTLSSPDTNQPQLPLDLVIDDPPPVEPIVRQSSKISINTVPWTSVSIDGRAIGNTPVSEYSLAPGSYKILMENRDQGKRKVQIVNLKPGEHFLINQEL